MKKRKGLTAAQKRLPKETSASNTEETKEEVNMAVREDELEEESLVKNVISLLIQLCMLGSRQQQKKRFAVYPSAYANAWLVREYKKRGGRYRRG